MAKVGIDARDEQPLRGSADAVFEGILLALYEGRYLPGQRLVEAELTARFGVGRSTVREALRRLAADAVVEINLHRGAFVRAVSRTDAREALLLMELVMGLAARLAAESAQAPGARAALRANYDRLATARDVENPAEFILARATFYRTLMSVGGHRELARQFDSMQVHLLRIQFNNYRPAAEERRLEDYQQITEAVVLGDAMLAEQVGRAHIRRVMHDIEKLPDEAFADPKI
jgi:DNA-binding GntR family transcriptional regulator